MKKLISMTDFVISIRGDKEKDNIRKFWACERYVKFLKQPLTLGMFVPCDLEGNVLDYAEKPLSPNTDENWGKWTAYQEAKERCLFEGFEAKNFTTGVRKTINFDGQIHVFWFDLGKWNAAIGLKTIEDLVKYNFELTPTAQKQLSL